MRPPVKCAAKEPWQSDERARLDFIRYRRELDLTQEELAPLLGRSRNTIASYEHPEGTRIPAGVMYDLRDLVIERREALVQRKAAI